MKDSTYSAGLIQPLSRWPQRRRWLLHTGVTAKAKANNPSRFSPNATVFLYWGRLPQRACTDSTIAPYRFHTVSLRCVCVSEHHRSIPLSQSPYAVCLSGFHLLPLIGDTGLEKMPTIYKLITAG
uniref:Uncharacterized protein n=1 Tax=Anguilla anguilla TaxID=7936 RepID=A0A0E9TKF8_ANGAN